LAGPWAKGAGVAGAGTLSAELLLALLLELLSEEELELLDIFLSGSSLELLPSTCVEHHVAWPLIYTSMTSRVMEKRLVASLQHSWFLLIFSFISISMGLRLGEMVDYIHDLLYKLTIKRSMAISLGYFNHKDHRRVRTFGIRAKSSVRHFDVHFKTISPS